jgi:hypothetical protein
LKEPSRLKFWVTPNVVEETVAAVGYVRHVPLPPLPPGLGIVGFEEFFEQAAPAAANATANSCERTRRLIGHLRFHTASPTSNGWIEHTIPVASAPAESTAGLLITRGVSEIFRDPREPVANH